MPGDSGGRGFLRRCQKKKRAAIARTAKLVRPTVIPITAPTLRGRFACRLVLLDACVPVEIGVLMLEEVDSDEDNVEEEETIEGLDVDDVIVDDVVDEVVLLFIDDVLKDVL